MSKDSIAQLIMFNYPEHIKLSDTRRPVYITPQDRNIPRKYHNHPDKYSFEPMRTSKGVAPRMLLVDKETGRPVIRNSKSKDTPRMLKINGQNIWSGMFEHTRNKMRKDLHEWFQPYVLLLLSNTDEKYVSLRPPKDHYLHIEYIFYFPFQEREPNGWQDYFNHAMPYVKTFEDTLVENNVLVNDSPMFVRGGYMRYVGIPTGEDRRMVVKFYHLRNNESI